MKAEAPRLLESAYPEFIRITTRFGDMDFNGHLNNVAFAQFFEDARVSFNRKLIFDNDIHPSARDYRVLVASVEIAYVREGYYGPDVTVGIGVKRIGRSSFELGAAVFQDGHCLAVHDSTVVYKGVAEGMPARARAALESKMLILPAT